jgi:apolipoprotein N-acyltransferase
VPFATVICYEDVFPGLVRRFVNRGAEFIVNISNESWFYESAEADQHFAIARCRSIENRIGLVRGTNSDISCIVLPTGELDKVLEQDGKRKLVEGWLTGRVALKCGETFYTRYGDIFAIVCMVAFVVLLASSLILRRSTAPSRQ